MDGLGQNTLRQWALFVASIAGGAIVAGACGSSGSGSAGTGAQSGLGGSVDAAVGGFAGVGGSAGSGGIGGSGLGGSSGGGAAGAGGTTASGGSAGGSELTLDASWLAQLAGPTDDNIENVVASSSGATAIAGSTLGNATLGTCSKMAVSGNLVVLGSLDANGACSWSKPFGQGSSLTDAALTTQGDVLYLFGTVGGSVDFGTKSLVQAQPNDTLAFFATFDASGTNLDARGLEGHAVYVGGLATSSSGDVWLAGSYSPSLAGDGKVLTQSGPGTYEGFVAHYLGANLTLHGFGGTSSTSLLAVSALAKNTTGLVIGGAFHGSDSLDGVPIAFSGGTYDYGAFVAGTDADSKVLWANVYGHANRSAGVTAVRETSAGFVATGEFTTSIDFGTQTLTTADDRPGLYVATTRRGRTPGTTPPPRSLRWYDIPPRTRSVPENPG